MNNKAIQDVLDAAVAAGGVPGLTAAVAWADGSESYFAAGARGAADPAAMTPETRFWIASCTKAITSAAALQLVERGVLDLDAPLGERLPHLAAPRVLEGFDAAGQPRLRPLRKPITLRTLLTHTSGMAYDFCNADLTRHFAATGGGLATDLATLVFDPGEGWQYGTGIDAAGWMIEAATGQGLDAYFAEAILGPLRMADTTFHPQDTPEHPSAALHTHTPDGAFAPLDMFAQPPLLWGGGGLFSTAPDYLKFLRAVMSDGAGVFGPQTLQQLRQNQTGSLAAGELISASPAMSHDFRPMPGVDKRWTLGFLRNESDVPGGRRAGSLAWGGIANCYYWADPASGVAAVMFAQFLPFADPQMLATFDAIERAVYAI